MGNVLSFSLASMMATTLFLWLKVYSVAPKFQTPVIISGLVTFIAAYHYMRIFNSWVGAYEYNLSGANPQLTGVPFNDAYRYMDWLLTVPMLLMEIVLVMNLTKEEASQKCWTLGSAAALMIVLGYPGEQIIEENELARAGSIGPSPWCPSCTSSTSFSSVSPTQPARSPTPPSRRRSVWRRSSRSSRGSPTPSSTCSPCSASRALMPWSPFSAAIASPTSSRSVASASSFTTLRRPSPRASRGTAWSGEQGHPMRKPSRGHRRLGSAA